MIYLNKTALLFIFAITIYTGIYSQDASTCAWKLQAAKTFPSGEYYNLPLAIDNIKYKNPNATTRYFNSNGQYFILALNVRPFPHTATQSEVEAANMKGNINVMYAAWNSYGPSWYGCGYAFTSNGGINWSGNSQTYLTNDGDPGAWIWPAGCPWAGRLGLSSIRRTGYSTNNGSSWTAITFNGTTVPDKNLSAVDDVTGSPYFGRAYTVWTEFLGNNENKIVGSYSANGGVTWDTARPVSPAPDLGHFNTGTDIEVGPGGVVYVVWAHCITNGQNSTEDNLGFAKSTNGGLNWAVSNNKVLEINGIRSPNLFNGIRVNGFPRIAIDNTGGPRNGWIYVTMAEKDSTPARDLADITFCRSTNGGSTWELHTRVNQDTPGNNRAQYFSDIDVAPDGSLVCSYYDQRNTTGFLTQYWLSRSTDGGTTWTDVPVSDHSFTPVPISGLVSGYQGDYTAITTCAGKIWPFWCDNSSGIYQVWTAGITIIGIQPIGNTVPKNFYLEQNYPNPFNPITYIEFSIPENDFINISLFDITGKAVGVIFKGDLKPGSFKVDYNASSLSSGVYFYKMTAGTFSATRKMILIR